jgi:uncharacterized membrane protein
MVMTDHPRWVRGVLSDDDLEAIARSVVAAESQTHGEIRVHLESRVPRRRLFRSHDALTRARHLFADLGMHRTPGRNAVLIYLAIRDRKVAIVADEGVHGRVEDGTWDRVRDHVVDGIRTRSLRHGIIAGVAEAGRVLARHFPRRPDDVDRLSDSVSLG